MRITIEQGSGLFDSRIGMAATVIADLGIVLVVQFDDGTIRGTLSDAVQPVVTEQLLNK